MTGASDLEVAVFSAARRLPPEERARYLDEACAGHAGLRQRIEELLRAGEEARGFLQEPAPGAQRPGDAPESPGPWPSAAIATERVGERIGRYKLLQQIGEGGCGVVYMAEQEEPVRRRVALKVIKLGMDTKQVIARFEAERQALAMMEHPHIAKVLDAGSTEAGRPYFVMELVRGIKISEYCDEHQLSTGERLGLFVQVCQAVQHAHQKGIIHRDLKPSNILVASNDGVAVAKVIDFGIAKATQGRLTDQTVFTALEQFIGTPAYMSPEQAELTMVDVDTRTDIYALGVLLYELLTGKTPFDTRQLLACGLDAMRRTIREQRPERPSTKLSTMMEGELTRTAKLRHTETVKLVHLLRGDLDWIVMKCLEKDRARRYETANGLAMDIQRYLSCEPVLARPPSRLYEFQKTVRRHKFGFAAAAAVIVVLAAGVLVSTWQAIRLGRANRTATEKLFDSYLAQTRARRRDNREGQRFESLETVRKAAAIHPSAELRNEAIACLAMTDVRFSDPQESPDPEGECWSPNLALRAVRKPVGIISVRDTRDGREVASLPSPGVGAWAPYGFSPDGRYLAVSYGNGRHVVWDVVQRQPAITNVPNVRSATFSADGQVVLFPCGDGQLRRFGLNPILPLPAVPVNPRYHGILLRPQGDWFAGYEPGKAELEVCDLHDGSLLRTFSHPSAIGTFAWSSEGKYLAVGCEDGHIFIWNALNGEKRSEFQGHRDTVVSLGFSHSGWLLGSSSWDGQFRLWDLAAGDNLVTTAGWSYQAIFSTNDLRIGRLQQGRESGALEITPSPVFHLLHSKASAIRGAWVTDVSPDGRLVAVASSTGVSIWADEQTEEPFFLPINFCRGARFTLDGANLIIADGTGLAGWPLQRVPGAIADELRIGPPQPICRGDFGHTALSWDGNWLLAANSAADTVSIFELRNPTNQFTLFSEPRIAYTAISPDGFWVAAGTFKGSGVKVWEFESRQVVCTLPTPFTAMVEFSPDNRWVGVSQDTFDLWEVGTWKRKYAFRRSRPDLVSPLAFSPDARIVALGGGPGLIHLIGTESGELLANLEAPRTANVSNLRFSRDGSQLFALEWDRQVQVWDLRRLRGELAKLNLDWSGPPIPAAPPLQNHPPKPLHISVVENPRQSL